MKSSRTRSQIASSGHGGEWDRESVHVAKVEDPIITEGQDIVSPVDTPILNAQEAGAPSTPTSIMTPDAPPPPPPPPRPFIFQSKPSNTHVSLELLYQLSQEKTFNPSVY